MNLQSRHPEPAKDLVPDTVLPGLTRKAVTQASFALVQG
jgi:hypothetical protein